MRKNINLTYVIMDNFVYGLTKKQTSPTSPLGFKSKTDPTGAIDQPVNPIKKVLAAAVQSTGQTTTGTYGPILITVTTSGSNIVQQVSLPSNVALTLNSSILNAQDLIAGIGNITSGTGSATTTGISHALLLLPVQVNSVSFSGSGNWPLESDSATTVYSAPQWTGTVNTSGLGDQNYAVAYIRNTTPSVGAKFKIPTGLGVTSVQIKASGPDSFGIPATTEAVGSDGTITLPATSSTSALPNSIKYYNKADPSAFTINWQLSVDGGNAWTSIPTKHTMYVVLAKPVTSLCQESLYEIGCREANGMTGDSSNIGFRNNLMSKIFGDFANLNLSRADGTPLTYYADYNTPASDTASLLAGSDGQCSAWAALLLDIRGAQGLGGDANVYEMYPQSPSSGLIVKNWNFGAVQTSGNASYPYLNIGANPNYTLTKSYSWTYSEVTQGQGIAGENNKTPASLFGAHIIAEADQKLYDPSYGTIPRTVADIQNMIAGLFLKETVSINGVATTEFLFNQNPPPHPSLIIRYFSYY